MKKKVFAVVGICTVLLMSGCWNKQLFDFDYTFTRAMIRLPDGSVVDGAVESWRDFEDGDQLQIKIDGVTYLVHSTNVALINDK